MTKILLPPERTTFAVEYLQDLLFTPHPPKKCFHLSHLGIFRLFQVLSFSALLFFPRHNHKYTRRAAQRCSHKTTKAVCLTPFNQSKLLDKMSENSLSMHIVVVYRRSPNDCWLTCFSNRLMPLLSNHGLT